MFKAFIDKNVYMYRIREGFDIIRRFTFEIIMHMTINCSDIQIKES